METARHPDRPPRVVVRWLLLGAVAAFVGGGTQAFDTGHHFDLTEAVLREEGFGATSIGNVQVANWLTDYYAVSPMSPHGVEAQLLKLHFDNLATSEDVARYWGWLVANARQATRSAAVADDPLDMLTLMGLLLHAVQDFYSHSNWVEIHPAESGAPYRRETWLVDGVPAGAAVFTGAYPASPSVTAAGGAVHGDYDLGLNKDSHVRPTWDAAYIFAYCATHEIVRALRDWAEEARPGFWARVRAYQVDEPVRHKLDLDLEAARKISMAVKGRGAEGHWKGGESGSSRYLSGAALEWMTSRGSALVRQIKKHEIQALLTAGLYSSDPPPPLPAFAGFDEPRTIVVVGTTYVAEKRGEGSRIDHGRKADLFAVTTVGAQAYIDRVLRNERRYTSPWLTIHVAAPDEAEIPIRIEIWDQDEALGRKDDPCDVNPAAGRKELSLRLGLRDDRLAGDVEGRYDGAERPFEIAGAAPDPKPVMVRAYVRSRGLRSR